MKDYQYRFIEFAMHCDALRFGSFTLKSGRTSPFFFNAGLFNTGERLRMLGRFYAETLEKGRLACDMLYGPAYKGIPLACATAIAASEMYARDYPYAFNRKEIKTHGDGGLIVGSALQGRVLIIDDVITAGTSVGESVAVIRQYGALPCGVLIALDRQEKTPEGHSTLAMIGKKYGLEVEAIITMDHVVSYLEEQGTYKEELAAIRAYRKDFGS